MHAGRARQRHVAHGHVSGRRVSRDGRASAAQLTARQLTARRLTARRLTVTLILTIGAAAYAGPASAANPTIYVNPVETEPALFTLMDIWVNTSWEGSNPVLIVLDGREVASGLTAGNGSYISGDVPVPPGVVFCGSNEVDLISDGDFIASTSVVVYCPTVEVTPNPLGTGGGPATFTATGAGYPPDRAVYLKLDGTDVPLNGTFTDSNGIFTTSLSSSALACGAHQLTATSQPQVVPKLVRSAAPSTVDATPDLSASTTFIVNGGSCAPSQSPSSSPTPSPSAPTSSTPALPPPSRGAPKIAANPTVLTDGTLTHVTGSGFVPNQPVTLTWQTPAGARVSVCSPNADSAPPLKADAKGAIATFCYAVPHEMLGAEQIVATQGSAHAAAPIVIEGGSMQPSSGGDQFIFRR